MSERTVFQSLSQRHLVSLQPHASVWEAACVLGAGPGGAA